MRKISSVNSIRMIVILITSWFIMMVDPVAGDLGLSQLDQNQTPAAAIAAETPAPNGATLLETRCSVCHSADKPKQSKKTSQQWEQTVTRMISKGAKLTDDEKAMLVDYLAKTYGP
jgi:hypothetical protein